MKISVIIIHWNTPELLRKQLANLADKSVEIIVIDNNSSNKPGWISEEYKTITYIENHINRGYAAACNQGAAIASAEWLLFLNPDVEINSEQIRHLIDQCQQKNLDACSPKPGSKDYQKPVPTWWALLKEFTPLSQFISRSVLQYAPTLTGGCLLIKSDVLHKLGGWDERFFMWFEDSDLTKRLVDGNYHIGWIDIPIKHLGGASFKTMDNQMKRDLFFHAMDVYAQKHFSSFGKLIVFFIKKRYTKRNVLPVLHQGVSITVPNMKLAILETFFSDNAEFFQSVAELIIVTSAVKNTDIWSWRRRYPGTRFILLKNNQGFASTVNIGMRSSTGRWIATVNDDTVLSHDWIQTCLTCDNDHIGALNPVIYHPNDGVESAGVAVLKKGKAYLIKDISPSKKCVEADAVNAAVVLYKNEALNRAGIFDERFGSYLEDIDLSLRIKRNGFKNIVCLNTKVTHIGHATSAQTIWKIKPWLDFRNWIYVIIKNWSISDFILNSPQIIVERMRNLSGVIKSM